MCDEKDTLAKALLGGLEQERLNEDAWAHFSAAPEVVKKLSAIRERNAGAAVAIEAALKAGFMHGFKYGVTSVAAAIEVIVEEDAAPTGEAH